MKRLPKVMKVEELKNLNTKRLLSYLKLLHQCEASFEDSDADINFDVNSDLKNDKRIQFKNTEKWKVAYRNVKSILKERENLLKGIT